MPGAQRLSDLLSAEERTALQEPYQELEGEPRVVTRALFPSVHQIDSDRSAALIAGLNQWMEQILQDLSRLLRVPCEARPAYQQSMARALLPLADEQSFWAAPQGWPVHQILLSLPRRFGAALCERIFGAPLELRADRALSPAEVRMMKDLARQWFRQSMQAWHSDPGLRLVDCEVPTDQGASRDPQSAIRQEDADWLRMTTELTCGAVESAIHVTMAPDTARLLLGERPGAGPASLTPEVVVTRLGEVPLEVRAVLGQAEFSLDELASLRVGDVIALDRRSEDPVELLIDDRVFFRARAGYGPGQMIAFELIGQPPGESAHGG
jgi:flagellar motor switch/type III secretory pathway protein FliN